MSHLDPSLIRRFDLFQSMDDEALRAVLADASTRRIPKGAALFEQAAEAREFFVLLDGRLKVVQVTPDGEQVLIRFVVPGEVCGVAVAMRRPDYPATASAVIDSLALVWESRHWDALCAKAPALAMNTLHTVGSVFKRRIPGSGSSRPRRSSGAWRMRCCGSPDNPAARPTAAYSSIFPSLGKISPT